MLLLYNTGYIPIQSVKSKMLNLLYKIKILFNLTNNKMSLFINVNVRDSLKFSIGGYFTVDKHL